MLLNLCGNAAKNVSDNKKIHLINVLDYKIGK